MSLRYGNFTSDQVRGVAAIDRAIAGAAEVPLTKEQKARICILAREAYDQAESQVSYDEWRRSEQRRATGIESLRDARNKHYNSYVAHFENLLGRSGRAFKREFKSQTEDRSWALYRLKLESRKAADVLPAALEYAAGFIRNRLHVSLEEAPARSLWAAIFMLRRRVHQLRRQARKANQDNIPF